MTDSFEPISRCQIVVSRKKQRDEMTLKIELADESVDRSRLTEDLNAEFQKVCRVKIDNLEFLKKGTLPEEYPVISDERTWQ